MTLTDHQITARFPISDLIVRGQDHTIFCPLYSGAALVVPDSGTVSIYRGSTTVVDAAAVTVTVTASIARYTISAATTAALTIGMGWRVEWALATDDAPDGFVLARNDAALVRHPLNPVIGDQDLYRRVKALDPLTTTAISSQTTWQDQIDEAWIMIGGRLIEAGNRPNLVMSPSSLREVHILATLALVYEDLASRLNPAFEARAQSYWAQFRDAWDRITLVYDADDDGVADSDTSRRSPVQTLWLNGR